MKTTNKIMIFIMGGTLATIGVKEIWMQRISTTIKESILYKEAMEMLRQHKGAIYFLGQPIEDHRATFINAGFPFNESSDVKVKVSGPKSSGIAFISVASNINKELYLDSVQLQIGKDDSKRLVVKKSPTEKSSES